MGSNADAPLSGDFRYIGYPLHGKKHSSLLSKMEFKKVLEKSEDYQAIVRTELRAANRVSEAHLANRKTKSQIAKLWRSVLANDRKVWGIVRQKAMHAHQRRQVALRLYRHILAEKLETDSEWKRQYDREDEGADRLMDDYRRDLEGIDVEAVMNEAKNGET